MPLYDFGCMHKHLTEAIRPSEVYTIPCGTCGRKATREFSSRVAIIGPTTDTRNMFRRYQEASAEIADAETKYERDHGQKAPPLNLWSTAKATANAMTLAGEAPPKEAL